VIAARCILRRVKTGKEREGGREGGREEDVRRGGDVGWHN